MKLESVTLIYQLLPLQTDLCISSHLFPSPPHTRCGLTYNTQVLPYTNMTTSFVNPSSNTTPVITPNPGFSRLLDTTSIPWDNHDLSRNVSVLVVEIQVEMGRRKFNSEEEKVTFLRGRINRNIDNEFSELLTDSFAHSCKDSTEFLQELVKVLGYWDRGRIEELLHSWFVISFVSPKHF